MRSDPLHRLRNAGADRIQPPPALLLSEWAREEFQLSSDYSAVTGGFEPYPYQIEPLDVLSPSHPCETMCLLCGSQMMKTLLMMILLGYVIDAEPGPVLIVQPGEQDAKAFSAERVAPMLRDVPCLVGKVHEAKSRDAGNTILQKRFNGGSVALTGAISPRGLRRRSIRYLLMDEIDGYLETADGDPIALAAARTDTFWNRKIVLCSTPTVEGRSRIADVFEQSDQRLFYVPCPLCNHMQTLEWANVRWGDVEGQQVSPEDAAYQCSKCRGIIQHHRKLEMLRAGEWRVTNPEGKYPGFRISRLYAANYSWGQVVTDPTHGWLQAQGHPEKLKTFMNNMLAETWREPGEAPPDYEVLMGRFEDYKLGEVPVGPLFLTAGVDVQKTWLEGYVWGWGRGPQRWLIDHFRLEKGPYDSEAWIDMDRVLALTYRNPSGVEMGLARLAIDTGYQGQDGQPVYAWARRHGISRVIAVDGRPAGPAVATPTLQDLTVRGRRIPKGCKLWGVNVSHFKSELYGQLNLPRPDPGAAYPAGWIHFPIDAPEEFYRQLTSEEFRLSARKGGVRKMHWEPIENRRHEALDCANYARAAAFVFGMDRHATDERWWASLDGRVSALTQARAAAQIPATPVETVNAEPVKRPAADWREGSPPGWLGSRTSNWLRR